MKRRGFFRCALALLGLKAIGADSKLLPNPDWVDAVPEKLEATLDGDNGWSVTTARYQFIDGQWKKIEEYDELW